MYRVMCEHCRSIVRLHSLDEKCPRCWRRITSTGPYEERTHDDGDSVLVPLLLLSSFSGSEPIHETQVAAFSAGGGDYGGAGASVSYDSGSSSSSDSSSSGSDSSSGGSSGC